jgi:nucleotide-binding universal stress UspA family protein
MIAKNILYPTDLSGYNDAALAYASVLAAEYDATLHILHADSDEDLGEVGYLYGAPWDENRRAKVQEELAEIRPPVAGVTYEHHYVRGVPSKEILRFVREQEIELVIMASHGRTGLVRLLMGSTAEEVMRKAPCPVLIVKQHAGDRSPMSVGDQSTKRLLK